MGIQCHFEAVGGHSCDEVAMEYLAFCMNSMVGSSACMNLDSVCFNDPGKYSLNRFLQAGISGLCLPPKIMRAIVGANHSEAARL